MFLNNFGRKTIGFVEAFLKLTKWGLVPLYAILLLTLIPYTYRAILDVSHLFFHLKTLEESELILAVLTLSDAIMIASLLSMIALGSYHVFVRKFTFLDETDKPQWLNKITPSTIKIKMGMSLIGVSSIHLLKDFINAEHLQWETIWKHVTIHAIFLLSTIALVVSDRLMPHPAPAADSNKVAH